MNVEVLMTRQPKTCTPADTLHRAAQIMWDHDCGVVPVVDGSGALVGIVTDRDVCMSTYTQGRPPHEIVVERVMSKGLFTLLPSVSVGDALKVFTEKNVRRLPVVDADGLLVGIVSISDLVCASQDGRAGKHVKSEAVLSAVHGVSKPRPKPSPEKPRAHSAVLVPKPRTQPAAGKATAKKRR